MSVTMSQLVDRYQKFTEASLTWCSKESEESTTRVSGAIDGLLKDTARVSALSEESLFAIEGMHSKLQLHLSKGASIHDLIKALQQLAQENDEVKNVIHPIIESLQFQDRLRQNLENISRMIPIWLEWREKDLSPEKMVEFGEALGKATTMKEERDFIRNHISGMPEEEEQDSVLLF